MKICRMFGLAVITLLFFAHTSSAQGISSSTALQLAAAQGGGVIKKELKLTRTLKRGMTGSDVKALQEYLLLIPTTGVEITVSGYFGSATESAVKKFQERESIANSKNTGSGYGLVGPRTLAKINEVVKRPVAPSKKNAATETATTTKTTAATSTSTAPSSAGQAPSATSSPMTVSASPARDTTPPLRSNGFPTGVIISTTSVLISLTTNEDAYCFWSNLPNTPFDEISTLFSSTGGVRHVTKLWSVSPGDYSFHAKCRDRAMNTNISDYPIIFSLQHKVYGRDRNPPRVFMSFPIDNNTFTEGPVGLMAVAADNSDVSGVNFFLNAEDLNAEDTTPPYAVTIVLAPGAYTAFAVTHDADGNYATSTTVTFSVTPKPSSSKGTTFSLLLYPERFGFFPLSAFGVQGASVASAPRGIFDLFVDLLFGIRTR